MNPFAWIALGVGIWWLMNRKTGAASRAAPVTAPDAMALQRGMVFRWNDLDYTVTRLAQDAEGLIVWMEAPDGSEWSGPASKLAARLKSGEIRPVVTA